MIIIICFQTTLKLASIDSDPPYYPAVNPMVRVKVMVFNATFNNISVISWLSVLLAEETENTIDLSQVIDCKGSRKSNYHTITTTTAPCKSNTAASAFEVHM